MFKHLFFPNYCDLTNIMSKFKHRNRKNVKFCSEETLNWQALFIRLLKYKCFFFQPHTEESIYQSEFQKYNFLSSHLPTNLTHTKPIIHISLYTEYGLSSSVSARSLKVNNAGPGPWLDGWPHVVSWGSDNNVNQMARLTELELDVKEPHWT